MTLIYSFETDAQLTTEKKLLYFFSQANCEYGRDSSESWGKRRRRSLDNATTEEKGDDMTLSQEILVLDFGDDKQSQFLKSDASIDFNEAGKSRVLQKKKNDNLKLFFPSFSRSSLSSTKFLDIFSPLPHKLLFLRDKKN